MEPVSALNESEQDHLDWINRKLTVGWEAKSCVDKRIYYVNHYDQSSHWIPPKENWEQTNSSERPLPYGYEQAFTPNGQAYYINHVEQTTQQGNGADELEDEGPPEPREVQLVRDEELGFGFVAGSERPVVVRFVTDDGPSADKLLPGDRILKIGDEDVENAPRDRVIDLVRSAADSIRMTVCQPYFDNGGRKSAILTEAKKAKLKHKGRNVRFAEAVTVNGTSVISPPSNESYIPFMPNVLKVFLENGQTKSFKYDSQTTVKHVLDSLQMKLDIQYMEHYSLVLQNVKNPAQGKMALLHEADILSEIAASPEAPHFKCWLRMTFVPRDFFELWKKDKVSFDYLYNQSCSDLVFERFGSELKAPHMLELAAVHMQQFMTACPNKPTLKQIQKDGAFEDFLPPSILNSMKSKDIKKVLTQHLKALHSQLLPGQKEFDDYQLKIHYLKLMSDVRSFGGKAFLVTYVEKKAEVVVVIGPKQGISLVANIKTNSLAQLADFDDINNVSVIKDACHNMRKVQFTLKTLDSPTMTFTVMKDEVKDMLLLLEGYYRVLVNGDRTLLDEELPKLLFNASAIPDYADIHHVTPVSWSYANSPLTANQNSPQPTNQKSPQPSNQNAVIEVQAVDLSDGPPSYRADRQELVDRQQILKDKLKEQSYHRPASLPLSSLNSLNESTCTITQDTHSLPLNTPSIPVDQSVSDTDSESTSSTVKVNYITGVKGLEVKGGTAVDGKLIDEEMSGKFPGVIVRPSRAEKIQRQERPPSFGLHSPDTPLADDIVLHNTGQSEKRTGQETATMIGQSEKRTDKETVTRIGQSEKRTVHDQDGTHHPSYNPKLFYDGGLYLDPDIIDLRAIQPPTPTQLKRASIHSINEASPPPEFSDLQSGIADSLPEDIMDLPPNLRKHIDDLIANDQELGTQMAAIDALLLGELSLEDHEKESGIESDNDSDKNYFSSKSPSCPDDVILRSKNATKTTDYQGLIDEMSKRQSYQHVNFNADSIEAFIASVSVPPPPKMDDIMEISDSEQLAKVKPPPPPKSVSVMSWRSISSSSPNGTEESKVMDEAKDFEEVQEVQVDMGDLEHLLGKAEVEEMLKLSSVSLEEEYAKYVIPPPPTSSSDSVIDIHIVQPPSPVEDDGNDVFSSQPPVNSPSHTVLEPAKRPGNVVPDDGQAQPRNPPPSPPSPSNVPDTWREQYLRKLSNPSSSTTPHEDQQDSSQTSVRNNPGLRPVPISIKPALQRPMSLVTSTPSSPEMTETVAIKVRSSTGTLPRSGLLRKAAPPPPPPRRSSQVDRPAEMPELSRSVENLYNRNSVSKFSTFGPSSHKYVPGSAHTLGGRSSERSIFSIFKDVPLSAPQPASPPSNRGNSAVHPQTDLSSAPTLPTGSLTPSNAPSSSSDSIPSSPQLGGSKISPHIQAKQEALRTALLNRHSSTESSASSVEIRRNHSLLTQAEALQRQRNSSPLRASSQQMIDALQRQRSHSPQTNATILSSPYGSPRLAQRSISASPSSKLTDRPSSPFKAIFKDRRDSDTSRSSIESAGVEQNKQKEEGAFSVDLAHPQATHNAYDLHLSRNTFTLPSRPWHLNKRSLSVDCTVTSKVTPILSHQRQTSSPAQGSPSKTILERQMMPPNLRTFSFHEDQFPVFTNGDATLLPEACLTKVYRGSEACNDACDDITRLITFIHHQEEQLVSPVFKPRPWEFYPSKEALIDRSRAFVTDSKNLVSSATQSQVEVIAKLQTSMKTFAGIVQLTARTLSSLDNLTNARDLATRVTTVAEAYRRTVGAAWLAAGKPLKDLRMKELMRHATGLASSLGSLMRTLKDLHNDHIHENGLHTPVDMTHL